MKGSIEMMTQFGIKIKLLPKNPEIVNQVYQLLCSNIKILFKFFLHFSETED